MPEAKDYNGNIFTVGDKVIIMEPKYRNFVECEVLKITEKMTELSYYKRARIHTTKQFHDQVIRKESE